MSLNVKLSSKLFVLSSTVILLPTCTIGFILLFIYCGTVNVATHL